MTNAVTLASLANSGYLRNRIINGAMQIDQRNAGASVNPGAYTLDRWYCDQSVASKYTVQQNSGSVTPPAGFSNYLGAVSSSAYSLAAGDYFTIQQYMEGLNVADLNWGTANAKTVTLSFWVRSSLTGTFGGALKNSAENRTYPFSYTISSASTWEYKTITIPGDTTGTWLTTNGRGIAIFFGLGVGTTYSGPAGAWSSTNYASVTGATSVVGTNGATFYITGVQFEVGTQATPFEWRPYPVELENCKRYFRYVGFGFDWPGGSNLFAGAAWNYSMRAEPSLLSTTYSLSSNVNTSNGVNGINPFVGYTNAATSQLGYQIVAAAGSRAYAWGSCALSAEL